MSYLVQDLLVWSVSFVFFQDRYCVYLHLIPQVGKRVLYTADRRLTVCQVQHRTLHNMPLKHLPLIILFKNYTLLSILTCIPIFISFVKKILSSSASSITLPNVIYSLSLKLVTEHPVLLTGPGPGRTQCVQQILLLLQASQHVQDLKLYPKRGFL